MGQHQSNFQLLVEFQDHVSHMLAFAMKINAALLQYSSIFNEWRNACQLQGALATALMLTTEILSPANPTHT